MLRNCLIALFIFCFAMPSHAEQLRDHVGNSLYYERPHTRIISLYAAHTENLFSLGLSDAIIGVTQNEDFPSAALTKPTFSTHDGVEKFLAAKPDLILIRPMQWRGYRGLWSALQRKGIHVLAFQPTSIKDMYAYWRILGRLTGHEPQAEGMIAEFNDGLETARKRLEQMVGETHPNVFFESIHKNYSTFSPQAMPIFVLKMAGGHNIASDARPKNGTNIASYGLERMLQKAKNIDVYLAQYGPMNQISIQTIQNGPAASRIKAVRNQNVFLVDEHLVSRPTLRLLKGIDTVHQLVHPDGNH